MRLILNTNDQICIPPESSFLTYFYEDYSGELSEEQRAGLARKIAASRKFEHWKMDLKAVQESMDMAPTGSSYSEVIRSVYEGFCSDKFLVGDKNNINWQYADTIQDLYPDARLVLLTRQPLDVYASLKSLRSIENLPYAPTVPKTISEFVEQHVKMILAFQGILEKNVDNVNLITYEAFVTNPQRELDRLSKFLGVENQFNRTDYFLQQSEPEDLMAWKQLTSKPLTTSRIDAWKTSLSRKEVFLLHKARTEYESFLNRFDA